MKPRDWRKQNKLSQADVAEKLAALIGSTVSHDLVSRLENGQMPTKEQGRAYVQMTDGAVQPGDFFDVTDAATADSEAAA